MPPGDKGGDCSQTWEAREPWGHLLLFYRGNTGEPFKSSGIFKNIFAFLISLLSDYISELVDLAFGVN